MSYLDFDAIKADHPIGEVADRLGLDLKRSGKQMRGKCPVCEGSGDRNLVITPEKGVYYCFSDGKGGDVIALVAHVKGLGAKEAAAWIAGDTCQQSKTDPKEKKGSERGFKPLDYLDSEHEAVLAVGFEPNDAQALGVGYAPRGVLRGTVAVPIRNDDVSIAGYIGITEAKLPPKWER
ncbi:MAG: CHC2 zinc finger domain-containing protein [Pseudomonadota bacterium]